MSPCTNGIVCQSRACFIFVVSNDFNCLLLQIAVSDGWNNLVCRPTKCSSRWIIRLSWETACATSNTAGHLLELWVHRCRLPRTAWMCPYDPAPCPIMMLVAGLAVLKLAISTARCFIVFVRAVGYRTYKHDHTPYDQRQVLLLYPTARTNLTNHDHTPYDNAKCTGSGTGSRTTRCHTRPCTRSCTLSLS